MVNGAETVVVGNSRGFYFLLLFGSLAFVAAGIRHDRGRGLDGRWHDSRTANVPCASDSVGSFLPNRGGATCPDT